MALSNKYPGFCLSCKTKVDKNKGFIKMKNPQNGKMINKKRTEPREWGVYCDKCFTNYSKTMKRKYHNYT